MAERALKSITPERDEAPDVREAPAAVPTPRPSDPRRSDRQEESEQAAAAAVDCAGACLPLCRSFFSLAMYWYVTGGKVMSTDDAYVNAEKVGISTDVAGIVKVVSVTDNQHVRAGQVLYRLDPRQFQIALDNAKANLAQTALTIDAMKQDYKRMLSDVAAQQAQVDARSDELRSRHNAAAQRHRLAVHLRSGPMRRWTPTRTSSNRCVSRRKCNWPSSTAMPTFP